MRFTRLLMGVLLCAANSGCLQVLCGFAYGYSHPGKPLPPGRCQAQSAPTRATAAAEEEQDDGKTSCTSDFSCGMGQRCVKGYLKSYGYCARAVNSAGVPDYSGPEPASIGPEQRQGCSFDTECTPGFRCDKQGTLYGRCVKADTLPFD